MITTTAGLPPREEKGTFIGFDSENNPYLLRWDVGAGCYSGIGYDKQKDAREWAFQSPKVPLPLHFLCRENMASFIVRHARVQSEKATCPRARSDMTPCVIKDGEVARSNTGVCVGCGVIVA